MGLSGMNEASARDKARMLLLQHGWNTTCWQILNPGIQLWFSRAGDAVVGFVETRTHCVVAGAPVCAEERLAAVLAEWESAARKRVCYFGAEGRLQSILNLNPNYAPVSLGAQPLWSPGDWTKAVEQDSSLRYQLNRARNKGVSVEEWPPAMVHGHPELRACLDSWLATRGLPAMHFLVEPDTLGHPEDRRFFVAVRNGSVVAFVTMSPIPKRRAWLTEQFPRIVGAPNGSVELALDAAVRAVGDDGAEMVTMGIVPLSAHGESSSLHNPPWLRLISRWAKAHGRRFYNFEGLDRFKTKFHPTEWEPIRVISHEPQFSLSTLYAVGEAFAGEAPWKPLFKAIKSAGRKELESLKILR